MRNDEWNHALPYINGSHDLFEICQSYFCKLTLFVKGCTCHVINKNLSISLFFLGIQGFECSQLKVTNKNGKNTSVSEQEMAVWLSFYADHDVPLATRKLKCFYFFVWFFFSILARGIRDVQHESWRRSCQAGLTGTACLKCFPIFFFFYFNTRSFCIP